jgi:hypothetical protein
MRVLIARKNFLTALHGFITTSEAAGRAAQQLASWGTRYSKRPFSTALHTATWGRTDEFALFHLPVEAVVAIQCWRAMLCLVRHRETEFTRSIVSFAAARQVVVVEVS